MPHAASHSAAGDLGQAGIKKKEKDLTYDFFTLEK